MSQAYQQVLLSQDSNQYVVINTGGGGGGGGGGLFSYNWLPYGISSAPGIFLRMMECLLQGMVYLNDILITWSTEEVHLETLGEVLRRIQEAGLKLRREKCVLMAPSVVYLGYRIDAQGLHPMPDKVKAVMDAPQPTIITELRSILDY